MKKIKIENGLIGRFYFKKTHNGNLIGEFSNNLRSLNFTESADLETTIDSKDFIGKYNTTWQEDNEAIFRTLIVSHKANTQNRIYSLEWLDGSTLTFIGEGFIVDGILINYY